MPRKYSRELREIEKGLKKAGLTNERKVYPDFLDPEDWEEYKEKVPFNGNRKGRMVGFYDPEDNLLVIGDISTGEYCILNPCPELPVLEKVLTKYGWKKIRN